MLYVAQGLPLGLFFFAMPAWLASNGASAGDIGLVASLSSLPWSIKFINGFIIDRFAYLPMGRRRAWVIGAQLLIVTGLLMFALTEPTVKDVGLIAGFSFAIMLFTTFQDVSVDSLSVDLIPDDERGRANGFMFGGQAIGTAIGTALTGFAIMHYGPPIAFSLVAIIVALILVTLLLVCERDGERRLPWSRGDALPMNIDLQATDMRPIIKTVLSVLARPQSLIMALVSFCTGTAYGIFPAVGPMLTSEFLGWNEARFSGLSSLGSIAGGLTGVLIGGFFTDHFGPKKVGMVLMATMAGVSLAMASVATSWADPILLRSFVIGWLVLDTLVSVAIVPILMRLCDLRVAATQFTIYMAIANLGISFAAVMLAPLQKLGGFQAMFLYVAFMYLLGMAALKIAKVGR